MANTLEESTCLWNGQRQVSPPSRLLEKSELKKSLINSLAAIRLLSWATAAVAQQKDNWHEVHVDGQASGSTGRTNSQGHFSPLRRDQINLVLVNFDTRGFIKLVAGVSDR